MAGERVQPINYNPSTGAITGAGIAQGRSWLQGLNIAGQGVANGLRTITQKGEAEKDRTLRRDENAKDRQLRKDESALGRALQREGMAATQGRFNVEMELKKARVNAMILGDQASKLEEGLKVHVTQGDPEAPDYQTTKEQAMAEIRRLRDAQLRLTDHAFGETPEGTPTNLGLQMQVRAMESAASRGAWTEEEFDNAPIEAIERRMAELKNKTGRRAENEYNRLGDELTERNLERANVQRGNKGAADIAAVKLVAERLNLAGVPNSLEIVDGLGKELQAAKTVNERNAIVKGYVKYIDDFKKMRDAASEVEEQKKTVKEKKVEEAGAEVAADEHTITLRSQNPEIIDRAASHARMLVQKEYGFATIDEAREWISNDQSIKDGNGGEPWPEEEERLLNQFKAAMNNAILAAEKKYRVRIPKR